MRAPAFVRRTMRAEAWYHSTMARDTASDRPERPGAPAREPGSLQLLRRAPSRALRGVVAGISGYAEPSSAVLVQREDASLVVPLVVSFGAPFGVGLGRPPGPRDRWGSFAAGLFAGPVHIVSEGGAACVQVDFTPLGAARFFGADAARLAGGMVGLGDVLGRDGATLRDRLAETPDWAARLALAEAFVAARLGREPPAAVAEAWRVMAAAEGSSTVRAVARNAGVSRQRLASGFRDAFGVGPKTVLRLMRFQAARRRALAGGAGWAAIAADCGFADQAHLSREFAALAGEPPAAWARRVAASDPRLIRDVAVG